MQSSVHEIRSRLLLLLLRAFVIVLALSYLFFLSVFGYYLTYSSRSLPMPFASTLEGFFAGQDSWEGVEFVYRSNRMLQSLNSILLDQTRRIVFDNRTKDASLVGSVYKLQTKDVEIELTAGGETVGYLIITSFPLSTRLGFVRGIIYPIGAISFVLGLFLIVIAVLLVRRFINPLADVIFAAHEVAGGKLSTRITGEGPQDLRSLSASFNEMASALERNDRERREMLADIAHELRTPLSVIRGRLEGIVDGVYPDTGSQVSLALEQTYLLQRLVDDLRLLTLTETRQLPIDKRVVDIDQLIRRVMEIFSAEAQEKNISIFYEDISGGLSVVVDPQRFEQVVSNLLANAFRQVSNGGKIKITTEESAGNVIIFINDNGPGVADVDLPYIFDRFWRKDKSRSRQSGGTGLGLAITKQLVEAQGGLIEARNLPEGGLQVVITLKK